MFHSQSDLSRLGIPPREAERHYQRNPQGHRPAQLPAIGPIQIQQYLCDSCDNPFSPSLPFIEDGFRYTDEIRRDVQAADHIYPQKITSPGSRDRIVRRLAD